MPSSRLLPMQIIEIDRWLENHPRQSGPLDDATIDRLALHLHRWHDQHRDRPWSRVPATLAEIDTFQPIGAHGFADFAG